MQMTRHKLSGRYASFAAAGLTLAAVLSGCGGASNNSGIIATPTAGPAVNGLSANDALGGTFFETSGLASPDATTAYLTGPVASTAKPSAVVASTFNGTIPLGFAPDGSFGTSGGNIGKAVLTNASVIFGASISNGNSATAPIPLNTGSVVLTSPEVAGFTQPLRFTASTAQTGPLVNAQYTTGAFALPFTTPGLHRLRVAVADQAGQTSTTDFDTVVVDTNTVALYASSITPAAAAAAGVQSHAVKSRLLKPHAATSLNPGDTAAVTNPVTGARTQATADADGVVILFTTPGPQTFTVTPHGGTAITQTIDLTGKGGTAVIQ